MGRRQVSEAIAAGHHPFPLVLDEILEQRGSSGQTSLGTFEIPLEMVVGTKTRGRQNMFSAGFLPIADADTEFALKWSELYDFQTSEGIRDPILVFEYLQHFYVQEGNKRVSVMRYLDAPTITASVTRVHPLPSEDADVRHYLEFERLFRVAPIYGLVFSTDGACEAFASTLGQSLDEPWPDDLVRRVRSSFRQFQAALRAHDASSLSITEADAFLIYLRLYATSDALGAYGATLESRIARIWGELKISGQDVPIDFIESPAEPSSTVVPTLRRLAHRKLARTPLRVAFVYDRSPSESGWVAQHEMGRLSLERRMAGDVETLSFADRAADADFEKAVAAAVADECSLVITTSPRQMEQTRRVALEYPATLFANCSLNLPAGSVRTFYARMYEVKFLMGALAAGLAENHRVGYVATSPLFGSVSEVNAFAIGASFVDPYATVHLKWLSAEGHDWRRELADDDVRIVCGRDYPDPRDADAPFGLYRTGEDGSVEQVGVAVWDWGRYLELMVRSIEDDVWRREREGQRVRPLNYWWGMSAGVVRLDLRPGIANGLLRMVDVLRRALLEGVVHPFEGSLVARGGEVVRKEGSPRLTAQEIASMSWLNDNIVGGLPKSWEIASTAADAVAVSGIISDETDAEMC